MFRHSIRAAKPYGARRALLTAVGTAVGTALVLSAAALGMLAGCSDGADDALAGEEPAVAAQSERTEATDEIAETDGAATTNQLGLEEQARRSPALVGREGGVDRPGRWRSIPGGTSELTAEQRDEVRRLESIGYLSGSQTASGIGGVTIHDRTRAGRGYNFYTSGHFPGAILMDMDGTVLHQWRCEFLDAFPHREDLVSQERTNHWRRAHIYPDGGILAIFEGSGIVRLDKDSNVIWALDNGAHHDIEVVDDGRIFVLTREAHVVPRVNERTPVLEDFLTILSDDGRELDRISILQAFWNSDYARALIALNMQRHGDVTHTNTLEILDGSLADRIPAFRRGSLLISFRRLDAIAVLDVDSREISWLMAGPWIGQHQPTVLPTGNILVFDNGGQTDISRVVEFNPVTQEEVWRYGGDRKDGFYSKSCGSNALLPGGTVLITESDAGRAFEVTRDGDIVWEYRNPARAGNRGEFIATLFEMVRLPEDFPVGWAAR